MKIIANKALFWFLQDGTELNMEKPEHIDLYIQQTLSYGSLKDIKELFHIISLNTFWESFERIKKFLPLPIRKFWEEYHGDIKSAPE